MKEIDKVKKKLKTWEWMNKHLGTCILSVYTPLITLYMLLMPFSFVCSLTCLLISFVTVSVGGYAKILYADDENVKILLEKQIAAMESITEEKLDVLTKSIENFKENPLSVKDKKTTKRLIKELIIIKNSAEKALREKNNNTEDMVSL